MTAARLARRLPARLLTLVLLIVVVYPLVWLFLGSLKSQYDYLNTPTYSLPTHWMWGNYKAAWVTGDLGLYIRNSVTAVFPALALVILLFSLYLIRASNLLGFVFATAVVCGGGFLFYKLVRTLSRIQMPKYPGP